MELDPVEQVQISGPNPYAFCVNDGINKIDPFGLWPAEIHNRIIEEAARSIKPRLEAENVQSLKTASAEADSVANGTPYRHAMREPKQKVEDAQKEWTEFIDNQLKSAKEKQDKWHKEGKCGYSQDALKTAGIALHAVMDATSPSHKGFQAWGGIGVLSGIGYYIGAGEISAHANAEQTILPAELMNTVGAFKAKFKSVFSTQNVRTAK